MNDIERRDPDRTSVALRPGNPDGKGLNGFLLDWYRSEPRGVVAKPQRQVLAEYFTSMLVLSASFKYKPAIGVANYLYQLLKGLMRMDRENQYLLFGLSGIVSRTQLRRLFEVLPESFRLEPAPSPSETP